jgi:hypothetical protein
MRVVCKVVMIFLLPQGLATKKNHRYGGVRSKCAAITWDKEFVLTEGGAFVAVDEPLSTA